MRCVTPETILTLTSSKPSKPLETVTALDCAALTFLYTTYIHMYVCTMYYVVLDDKHADKASDNHQRDSYLSYLPLVRYPSAAPHSMR